MSCAVFFKIKSKEIRHETCSRNLRQEKKKEEKGIKGRERPEPKARLRRTHSLHDSLFSSCSTTSGCPSVWILFLLPLKTDSQIRKSRTERRHESLQEDCFFRKHETEKQTSKRREQFVCPNQTSACDLSSSSSSSSFFSDDRQMRGKPSKRSLSSTHSSSPFSSFNDREK